MGFFIALVTLCMMIFLYAIGLDSSIVLFFGLVIGNSFSLLLIKFFHSK